MRYAMNTRNRLQSLGNFSSSPSTKWEIMPLEALPLWWRESAANNRLNDERLSVESLYTEVVSDN